MNAMTTAFGKAELSQESKKYIMYGLATAAAGLFGYITYRLVF